MELINVFITFAHAHEQFAVDAVLLGFVTGTAVVSNKVTDVIDTSALLESLLGIPSGMYEDNYNEMTVV